ncbi:hypothetical protein DFR38_12528 [Aquitalea magnusonii]|uniref:DUF560 domain-containing protein n=2 Tax=Aquitalea magnusonii TaxID=332411 RepID=A0A318J2I7_9NEIS|nr:hypothetical protein DFR38_12528 [Aquitalea magnusonii]
MTKLKFQLVALAVATLCSGLAMAANNDGSQIKQLLDAGKHAEAYAVGQQHPEWLNNTDAALFYGIAALDSGHVQEALTVLRTYADTHPKHRTAQFHLARARMLSGELVAAEAGYTELDGNASPQEKILLAGFLNALQSQKVLYKPTLSGFAELGLGRDSNVNTGVNVGGVAGLPSGFVVAQGASNQKVADNFATLGGNLNGTYPLLPGKLIGYAGINTNARWNETAQNRQFDTESYGINSGVTWLHGRYALRGGIDYNRVNLDNANYLSTPSFTLEGQYQRDAANRFALAAQYGRLSYNNVQVCADLACSSNMASGADWLNSNLSTLGFSWQHNFAGALEPQLSLSLIGGEEKNRLGRADLSRNLYGINSQFSLKPTTRLQLTLGLGYLDSHYQAAFADGLNSRQDQLISLSTSAAYQLDTHWSGRLEYGYSRQLSNIGLFDYSRHTLAAKLRYAF